MKTLDTTSIDMFSDLINVNGQRRNQRMKKSDTITTAVMGALFFPLVDIIKKCSGSYPSIEDVVKTTILASIEKTSVDDICDSSKRVKSGRTVRQYLGWLQLDELEEQANSLLQQHVVDLIRKKWVRLAVDFHNVPYYGSQMKDENEIRKSLAKNGTSKFHSYLTVYAFVRNHRYTIAIRYVRRKEDLSDVLEETLDEISALDLNIREVLLDKEFYNTRVINYLQENDMPFIIAVPQRGLKIKALRVRADGGRCIPSWPVKNAHKEVANVCLQCYQKYTKGSKILGGGATWFFYATHMMPGNPKRISNKYRKRFGIESSYRMMNSCRARTSSKNPAIRFLFVLIAFLIVNLKVMMEWLRCADGRLSRKESTAKMRLKKLRRNIDKILYQLSGTYRRLRQLIAGGG
jgi:putative transposase